MLWYKDIKRLNFTEIHTKTIATLTNNYKTKGLYRSHISCTGIFHVRHYIIL